MSDAIETDLCVIGAGSGGLSVAAGAAQMGARVVLVERGKMGGDCLNSGCVPSKSLIAAAHAAHVIRSADRFGVLGQEPEVDFRRVREHVRDVIAAIAPHDSVERFQSLGVMVIQDQARFTSPGEIEAGGHRVRARRFVVATGSAPAVPSIPGLAETPYLTNESIFDLDERPSHLVVIGGGPIGIELAQAHRRLGAAVTVLEHATILPKDDPEAVEIVRARLLAEGVALREGSKVSGAARRDDGVSVMAEIDGREVEVEGSHLLVAAGRRATFDGLGLDEAGVEHTEKGIKVDDRLRTTNKRIFAIGDVTGGLQFTHAAGHHAGIVIRNALFRWPAKATAKAVPWVTYTDPELAQVGLSAAAAEAGGHTYTISRFPFAEIDRARAERETGGFAKIVLGRRGKVLGATIVGHGAGELILPWALAIDAGLGIGAMAGVVAPYPTFSEVSKRAAGAYYAPKLFSPLTRSLIGFSQRWG